MTIGKPGVAGNGDNELNGPSDVQVAPNGDIFIADGHGDKTNDRIVKYSHDGKFLATWGHHGSGQGEFDVTHGLAMDSLAGCSSPTGRTIASRSSIRTENSSPSGSNRPAERVYIRETSSMSPTRNRATK